MALSIALVAAFVFFIVVRTDAWPFSAWQMYSQYLTVEKVAVLRAQLKRVGSESFSWWEPWEYKDKSLLNDALWGVIRRTGGKLDPRAKREIEAILERKVLGEIERVNGAAARAQVSEVRVLMRTVSPALEIRDTTVITIDCGRARLSTHRAVD